MPSNTPDPNIWQAEKLSWNRIADYKPFTMVDGPGVRCALYVSGCPFKCADCFNILAQSFHYGSPWSEELKEQILKDLDHPAVSGLSLVGGEPFLNTEVTLDIATSAKEHFPEKTIWCWSGYTFEELLSEDASDKNQLLETLDVLVDGRYENTLRNLNLRFRGSSNQRIIDVPKSLQQKRAILKDI